MANSILVAIIGLAVICLVLETAESRGYFPAPKVGFSSNLFYFIFPSHYQLQNDVLHASKAFTQSNTRVCVLYYFSNISHKTLNFIMKRSD